VAAWVNVFDRSTRTPKAKSPSSPEAAAAAAADNNFDELRREAPGAGDLVEDRRAGGVDGERDDDDFFFVGVGETVFLRWADCLRLFCWALLGDAARTAVG
jgi:hypothetical protein